MQQRISRTFLKSEPLAERNGNTTSSSAMGLEFPCDETLILSINKNIFEKDSSIFWLADGEYAGDDSGSFKQEGLSSSLPSLPGALIIEEFLNVPINEVILGLLVVLSSFLVAVATIPSLDFEVLKQIMVVEDAIACLFFIEFFLRWYSRFEEPNYLTRPLVLVDILVVILPVTLSFLHDGPASHLVGQLIPPWLAGQSGLVNLRLLRILRLQRVLKDLETFARFQTALGLKVREIQNYQLQLARVVLSLFTLVSVSTGLIYTFEHVVNPQIPDYFTALYFGLTTLTTVGFGDITPITPEGKLVVSGSILAGVAIIPAQAASLVEALYERQTGATPGGPPRDGMVDTRTRCPTCGATFHWSDASFCWSCGSEL
jgi:voltage-gated potassium channel